MDVRVGERGGLTTEPERCLWNVGSVITFESERPLLLRLKLCGRVRLEAKLHLCTIKLNRIWSSLLGWKAKELIISRLLYLRKDRHTRISYTILISISPKKSTHHIVKLLRPPYPTLPVTASTPVPTRSSPQGPLPYTISLNIPPSPADPSSPVPAPNPLPSPFLSPPFSFGLESSPSRSSVHLSRHFERTTKRARTPRSGGKSWKGEIVEAGQLQAGRPAVVVSLHQDGQHGGVRLREVHSSLGTLALAVSSGMLVVGPCFRLGVSTCCGCPAARICGEYKVRSAQVQCVRKQRAESPNGVAQKFPPRGVACAL